jgi:hypothetical protein
MDAATLEALKGSIGHWEDIVACRDNSSGVSACALCAMFREADGESCTECPVKVHTGMDYCSGSPHEEFADALMAVPFERKFLDDGYNFRDYPHLLPLAQAELDFLKSLLPVEA